MLSSALSVPRGIVEFIKGDFIDHGFTIGKRS
jgi:hypothetical protein